jgi:hypothetical protein
MATFADLKPHHRVLMNSYPFSRYTVKDNPQAKLGKPLGETKFALITSAGLRLVEDAPFDHSIKLGDTSFREIPNETDAQALIEDHKSSSFDHSGVESDKNLALPLERFREWQKQGKIKSLNRRHFSFMGSILNPRRLIKKDAPEVARRLKADGVEAVFLTPV